MFCFQFFPREKCPHTVKSPFYVRRARKNLAKRRRLLDAKRDAHIVQYGTENDIVGLRTDRKLAHWLHMLIDGRQAFGILHCWKRNCRDGRNNRRRECLMNLLQFMSDLTAPYFTPAEIDELDERGRQVTSKFHFYFKQTHEATFNFFLMHRQFNLTFIRRSLISNCVRLITMTLTSFECHYYVMMSKRNSFLMMVCTHQERFNSCFRNTWQPCVCTC